MSLLSSLWWNLSCLLYEISKLVTYSGLVPPTLFRTLGGKPSLFGSVGRRLELHGSIRIVHLHVCFGRLFNSFSSTKKPCNCDVGGTLWCHQSTRPAHQVLISSGVSLCFEYLVFLFSWIPLHLWRSLYIWSFRFYLHRLLESINLFITLVSLA